MRDNKSVYILILTWNNAIDTIECIDSVFKNNYSNYRIVLINNGSTDNSIEQINEWLKNHNKKSFYYSREIAELGGESDIEKKINHLSSSDKIIIINNNENFGFAAGNNVGIKYAIKSKANYVCLLNNDTTVNKDFLQKIVYFLENNKYYSAATGQIKYYDNHSKIWNCGGKLVWYGGRKYYYTPTKKQTQRGYIDISFVTGCLLVLKTDVFKEIGILSEKYFFGEEDFDFALRMKDNNKKMVCVVNSVIFHKVGRSINTVSTTNKGRIFIYYLNRYIDLKQYWSKAVWNIWRFTYLLYIFPLLKIKAKFSISDLIIFAHNLINYSNKLNSVDKLFFRKAIYKYESLKK